MLMKYIEVEYFQPKLSTHDDWSNYFLNLQNPLGKVNVSISNFKTLLNNKMIKEAKPQNIFLI